MTANQTGSVNIHSPGGATANLAIWNVTDNSPTAGFSLGDTSANILNVIWRPGNADELHIFENNSAAPCVIYPNVRIQSGGGIEHVLLFQGTGDWRITNNIIMANSPGTLIQKTGSGTMYWNGPSISAAVGNGTISSPITIAGGTMVLQNNTVLSPAGVGTTGTQGIDNNGDLFKYDAPSLAQTLTGVITGIGNLEVGNGTLTLSGANTYSGNTILSGGALIVNRAESEGISGPLGVGGTISFTGGALQFSANNTFDYSSRFDTAAGQAYKIDTGGQNVVLATGLASSGATFTKLGSGTLTLAGASSYSGLTTVSAGRLLFQGAKSGSGNITVADGATLGVTGTGTKVTPGTLTVGATGGATLGFNNVTSTTTEILAAGTLSSAGTITINVNSGTFAVGQSYPLFTWTSGSAPTVALGTLSGAVGNLSIVGNKVQLNVTGLAYVWSGANNANWDTTTANNWLLNGSPAAFADSSAALFDDTASGPTDVTLNSAVSPASVAVNSSAKNYSITSSGANVIGGASTLTKAGSSTLTLIGGVNSYSGATTIGGGTLSVAVLGNGGAASDIGAAGSSAANLVFDSGTLQYTGGAASSDRLFTVGASGGTIDASGSGALTLNNSGSIGLSGPGARVLTLTGTSADDNTLAAALADNGGATVLTKSGAGKWVVTGNNTHSGGTTVASGTLQVGTGGANGALGGGNITDNGSLDFNTSATLTNGTISGTGSLTKDGSGTVILPGDNSYSGGTTINAGTLQIGNGGATGKLSGTSPVVDNGTLIVNSTGSFTLTGGGVISGTGNLIVRGNGGLFQAIGENTYTGWTLIEPGATFQPAQGNQGALVSSVVTNNGTLKLVRQDTGIFIYSGNIVGTGRLVVDANNVYGGDTTLSGNNTYTGGTFISDNTLVLGDGVTVGGGTIVGDVMFTNSPTPNENMRKLTFNHPEDYTFSGNIIYSTNLPYGNRGIVEQDGIGTLTLTGNNTYPGGTVISNVAGALIVGNGGTTGAIGTGPVTDDGTLVFNRSDDYTFDNVINGQGNVTQMGAGTLTLNGTNNIYGTMTVSNGSVFMNNDDYAAYNNVAGGTLGGSGTFYGYIMLAAGTTLAPGASPNAVGTLTAPSGMEIDGNMAVQVDKSQVQSNDLVVTSSVYVNSTGTLNVANIGPSLAVGDKFTLFSTPTLGGSGLTVTGAGATWKNDLDTDGSITVLTAPPPVNLNPPVMQVSVSGNTLSLAWPTNSGWTLETNSVGLTAADQWFPYPGSASVTNVNININPAQPNVFFRMVYP
jgi:autotransporter-associated beta strand protein